MNHERTDATTDQETQSPPAVEPATRLSVGARDAAEMCGVSERAWWRLDSAGKVPPSFMLGGRRVWRTDDLKRWAEIGYPSRDAFAKAASTVPETAA